MGANATLHTIVVCARCRDEGGRLAAAGLVARLTSAGLHEDFAVETVGCMAGCDRPVAVAFRAAGKASFLFGDISAERDVPALAEFAKLYRSLPDGWCNEGQRPAGLRGKTLARIPAAPAPER